ncbi:MAG: hypothetical protein KF729_07735 [Sandaracinaceae bacterium]|nr:hypothetical protein [Sandaracinaceae bacterium]
MFRATLRQHYALSGVDLLVLDAYDGDVGPGDALTVALPDGGEASCTVRDLAWGSAMNATQPPLTLIVEGLGAQPAVGAEIRSAT